jgi:hypothetical protein
MVYDCDGRCYKADPLHHQKKLDFEVSFAPTVSLHSPPHEPTSLMLFYSYSVTVSRCENRFPPMTQWTSIHHSLPNQGLTSIHSLAFLFPPHRPSRTLTPSSMIQCPPLTVRLPADPIPKKSSSLSLFSPVSPAAPSVFHHGNSS